MRAQQAQKSCSKLIIRSSAWSIKVGEKKCARLFDQNDLPRKEQAIRNRIKREGFWMR